MTRVVLVYESKYGNTKLVAKTIAEGVREVGGIETILCEVKEVDFDKILDYDVILIGSPNHIGRPLRSVRKFIEKLGKLNLEGKQIAVFDTCIGSDFEKAVKKMEKRISEKVPGLKPMVPGLSIKVQGIKGPILDGELPRCKDFGRKIGTQINTW